jgi:hypothetical protein
MHPGKKVIQDEQSQYPARKTYWLVSEDAAISSFSKNKGLSA